jgi:glyoxylate reductase
MRRPRVFVTRSLGDRVNKYLKEKTDPLVWSDDLPPSPAHLQQHMASRHGLLTLLTDRIDEALFKAAPELLVVSNMATGYDNIDVEAATRHAVLVTRTPGVLTETTADFAFALLLAAARRVVEGDRYTRKGFWKTWDPYLLAGPEVHGATLGIIGLGRIGAEVARRARSFGMRVLYNSRSPKPDLEAEFGVQFRELRALLSESDYVTLHAALTPETQHMINTESLRVMKETAILINTGRGGLIDQRALYEALEEGAIYGAALDVTDPEPIAPDDPLLSLPNVIVTPHIASASVATRSRMAMLAAENLLTALRGEIPEHAINPEIAESWRNKRLEALSG